jgi:hypothetical protein
LEVLVLLAPAAIPEEIEGKRRVVIARGELSDSFGIIEMIFARDAARIRGLQST